MKFIGIFIVVACVVANLIIGSFLFYSGFLRTEESSPTNLVVSNDYERVNYPEYGFSFEKNKLFVRDVVDDVENIEGSIDDFYIGLNDAEETFDVSLDVYLYPNVNDRFSLYTSEDFKDYSKKTIDEETKDSPYNFEFIDAEIFINKNNVKMYAETISWGDGASVNVQKTISFYHKGNEISIALIDSPTDFKYTEKEIDKIADSVILY